MRASRALWSSLLLVAAAAAAVACSKHEPPSLAASVASDASAGSPSSTEPPAPAESQAPDDARFPSAVAALAWETRVHEGPASSSTVLGYLRAGSVVRATKKALTGDGCHGSWRAIAPAGYVCVEPDNATTDLDDAMVHALGRGADPTQRLPYLYGIARRNSPIYARLPTLAEAERVEPDVADRMRRWLSEGDGAAFRPDYWLRGKTAATPPAPPLALWEAHQTADVPDWLAGGKFPPGNLSGLRRRNDLVLGKTENHDGFAVVDSAVVDGRRYAITTDLLMYPVDRIRPIEGSTFSGVHIPKDIDFPFALVRREGAVAKSLRGGALVKAHAVARRSAVSLSGTQRIFDGVLHFQTNDGLWLSERYASRVDAVHHMPKWANDGERWLDVSIAKQVLVAYDGTHAVYATLVSTGEAGLEDPETTKSTVRGIFRIYNKNVSTTMSSTVIGEEFELKDIPYVQYFEEGYALHAAYWHDDFGIPRSHGCVNLAPEDARWLFQFTAPEVPPGWHGVKTATKGSVVFVHQ